MDGVERPPGTPGDATRHQKPIPGAKCRLTRDIVIDGRAAFLKDEAVCIEEVSANPERPEYCYVVTSRHLDMRKFQLSDDDLKWAVPPDLKEQAVSLRKRLRPRVPGIIKRNKAAATAIALVAAAIVGGVFLFFSYGMKWRVQFSLIDKDDRITRVAAVDGTAFAIGDVTGGTALYSRGPAEWTAVERSSTRFSDVAATDAQHVWVTTSGGYVLFYDGKTLTGQLDMSNLYGGATDCDLYSVCASNPSNVWAAGELTYYPAETPGWRSIDDPIKPVDTGVVYYFNGDSWSQSVLLQDERLLAVTAADAGHVWVASADGDIFFFDGTSWNLQYRSGEQITALAAADDKHVWAASGSGSGYDIGILPTAEYRNKCDGKVFFFNGSQWALQCTMVEVRFRDLCAIDSEHVWAVGIDAQQMTKEGTTKQPFEDMDLSTRGLWSWNGRKWSAVPGPPGSSCCTGFSAGDANDLWIAARNMLYEGHKGFYW